jgi:hypothetical protein
MSNQPTHDTGKRRTRRAFGYFTPVIVYGLLVYLLVPRAGFDDTLQWYIPEMLLLGFNVAVLLVGGAMWLFAKPAGKRRKKEAR